MFRSLTAISIAFAATSVASAGLWVVDRDGNHDFNSVQDAFGDVRLQDGDILRILTGTYGGFDTGDKVVTIEPGNSPGIVYLTGNSRVRASATTNFEIAGLNSGLTSGPVEFDQFIVSGNMNYEGTLGIRLTNGFAPAYGQSWALIQASGTIAFTGITTLPALQDGLSWNIQVVSGSSVFGSGGASLVASVVPAPGAAALVGLAGLATSRRRRA